MTHINAYIQDVFEAQAKVRAAQAELQEAENRLAAKRIEDGEAEESQEVTEDASEDTGEEKKKIFNRR